MRHSARKSTIEHNTMTTEPRIVSATILDLRFQHAVMATLDNGESTELFRYYPDELSFSPSEFIGLTVEDGSERFTIKDMAYLGASYTPRSERLAASKRQAEADLARANWWKAWEWKVLAKRSGINCILRAPEYAGWSDLDDIVF